MKLIQQVCLATMYSAKKKQNMIHRRWSLTRSIVCILWSWIVPVRVVLKRTVLRTGVSTTWAEVVFRVKWIVLVSLVHWKFCSVSDDVIGYNTRLKLFSHCVLSHRLILVSFDPSLQKSTCKSDHTHNYVRGQFHFLVFLSKGIWCSSWIGCTFNYDILVLFNSR